MRNLSCVISGREEASIRKDEAVAGRVIQGFFAGRRPRVPAHMMQLPFVPGQAVQPKATPRMPGPPMPTFAGQPFIAQPKAMPRPPGPPAPAFASRPSVAQAKALLGPPAPAIAAQGTVAQARGTSDSFAVDPGQLGLVNSGGKPLPDAVRRQMEAALGADFSAVRVHVGPQAERIGAVAFTTGNDVYFAPGRFQPNTIQGKQLLGHELAHVVQQRQGRVRSPLGSALAVVQDLALEIEADRIAERVSHLQATCMASNGPTPLQTCSAHGPLSSRATSTGVAQPFPAVVGGIAAGGAAGFLAAGPAGLLAGGIIGGAALHWWSNRATIPAPAGAGAAGASRTRRRRPPVPRAGAAGAGPSVAGPSVAGPSGAGPSGAALAASDYEVGTTVESADLENAKEVIEKQNEEKREALRVAKQLGKKYKKKLEKYTFNRHFYLVPTPDDGLLDLSCPQNGKDYQNLQLHFPPNGQPYREYYINPGVGVAGNLRLIESAQQGGTYQRWAGYSITHLGPQWVRVWNEVGKYWQEWDVINKTATNLPGHAVGQPQDTRTEEQKQIVQHGIEVKVVDYVHQKYRVFTKPEK